MYRGLSIRLIGKYALACILGPSVTVDQRDAGISIQVVISHSFESFSSLDSPNYIPNDLNYQYIVRYITKLEHCYRYYISVSR